MAAEVFGIAAGALSVAALFNNIVDCFEYIQLGRQMGPNHDFYRTRLLLAKTRLVVWGRSININSDPRFNVDSPSEDDLAIWALRQILARMQDAYEISRKYKIKAGMNDAGGGAVGIVSDMRLLEENEIGPAAKKVRSLLEGINKAKGKVKGLTKKVSWALYDGQHLETLVKGVVDGVGELRETYPAPNARSIVSAELSGVDDVPSLRLLENASQGVEPEVFSVARERMGEIYGKTTVTKVNAAPASRVAVVDYVSSSMDPNFNWNYKSEISVGTVDAVGQCNVTIGRLFGGKSPLD